MARRQQRRKDTFNQATDSERDRLRQEYEARQEARRVAAEEAAAEAVAAEEAPASPAPSTPTTGGIMDTIRNSMGMGGAARAVEYAVDTVKAGWADRQKADAVSQMFGDSGSDLDLAMNYGRFGATREDLEAERATAAKGLPAAIAQATQASAEANERLKAMEESVSGGRNNPALFAARAVGNVASQPEMVLPLAGGAVGSLAGPAGTLAGATLGSVPMADLARKGALAEAVSMYQEAGVDMTEEDRQDVEAYAAVMMGTEFALDTLGGATGGIVTAGARRLGINSLTKEAARGAIVGRIRSRTARTLGAAAAEGLTEGGTELLQEGVRNLGDEDFFSNEEVTNRFKVANADMAANRLERVLDATAAGSLGGGLVGGIGGNLAVAAEEGHRQQALTDQMIKARDEARANAPAPTPVAGVAPVIPEVAPTRAEPEQMDMFETPADLPTPEQYEATRLKDQEMEAGFQIRERQLTREREDAEYRESYPRMVRNAERRMGDAQQQVEILQDRMDSGDVSQQDMNRMTEALREQRIAEDAYRQLESNPPVERVVPEPTPEPAPVAEPVQQELPVTTDQTLGPVAARRKRLAEKKAAEEKKKTTTQKAAESRRRNEIMDRIIDENPDLNDSAIQRLTDEAMAQPVVEADPIVDRATEIIERSNKSKSAANTRKVNDQLRAIQRRNPDMTPEQIAEVYRGQNPEVQNAAPDSGPAVPADTRPTVDPAREAPQNNVATVPDRDAGDAEIDQLAAQLGLSQQGTAPARDGDFQTKAKAIARSLVRANTQPTTDVQNLILQGKVIVAKDQAEVGRPDNGAQAEYDIGSGQMYLYADRIDPENVPAVLGAALHESVHAGQFNERAGRGSVMATLMGDESVNAANDLIRRAADSGNAVAKRAVERAADAGPDAALEVVPYFITEATNARGRGLGRLAGLWNDMQGTARGFVRDQLGVDLDINLAELEAAGQRAAGEAVNTPIRGRNQEGSLNMISGRSNPAFAKAEAEGRVYRDKDGQYKFITSDADSRLLLNPDVARRLREGQPVTVKDVVDNPTIREGYPQLLDVPVVMQEGLRDGAAYSVDENGANELMLGETFVDGVLNSEDGLAGSGLKSRLHSVILHELQHGIQNVENFAKGGNPAQFRTPEDNRLIEEHRNNVLAHNLLMNMLNDDLDTLFDRPAVREDVRDLHREYKLMDIDGMEFATGVARALRRDSSPSREALNFRNELVTTMRDYERTAQAKYEMENRTTQQYLDLHGEAESRFVENNRDVPQDELPIRPDYGNTNVTMEVGGQSLSQSPSRALDNVKKKLPGLGTQISAMFDSAIGTGPKAREIMEYAVSSPAKARMEAEQSMARFDLNIKDLAAERGVGVQELLDQINKDLDAIDRTGNSYVENKAAFEAVARNYGRAGEDLIDLRDQADALTLDILRQRASYADSQPLTPAEKETYQTLRNNLGRYAHRTYAVNAGQPGKKYANKMWDDYKTGDNIENRKTVANAVEYLVDRNLYIPDVAEIQDVKIEQLRDLVQVWGLGRPEAMTREEMQDTLLEARDAINGDSNRMTEVAEGIAQELLGLSKDITSPITSYYRGGRRNDGILKNREAVPAELRALMGEIVHPAGRLLITAAKQAEFVARNRALIEMRNASRTDPKLATQIQPPSAVGTDAARGMTPLTGETWGALENYLVSPNMRSYLSDVTQQLATFEQATAMAAGNPGVLTDTAIREGLGLWGKIAGTSKALQIIGNPVNFMFNFVGAPRMLLSNGNINPATWARAIKSSGELISHANNARSASEEAKRLNTVGVTDSAFIGELKSLQFKRMGEIVQEMSGDEPGNIGRAYGKLKQKGVTLSETYAMMDVWSKIANFYDQVDVLTRYNEAAGMGWSPNEIDRRAADNVNRTNITYKRAAPLVKAAERSGFTQFGTYFYEVFRSEVANVKQAVLELGMAKNAPTPEAANIMRTQAVKRMGGQLLSWGLTAYAAQGLSSMVFGDDEEENKGLRALLPEYMRDQDFFNIGKNENGEQVLLNVSRIDPMGPMTDIMRSMMHEDGDAEDISKKVFDLYVAPRVGTQAVQALLTLTGERPTRTPLLQQINKEAYSNYVLQPINGVTGGIVNDNHIRGLVNVAEAFAPGVATSWRESNVRPVPDSPGSAVATALSYAGMTMYKLDPKRATQSLGFEYKDQMSEMRRDLRNMFIDNPDTLSETQIIGRLSGLREKEASMNQDVNRTYRGMIALGSNPREARKLMLDNGLPREIVSNLGRASLPSTLVSRASINSAAQKEAIGKTDAEKREIKQKWANVWTTLNGANRELNRRQTEEN